MENGRLGHDPLVPVVAAVALGDEEALRALYDSVGPLVLGLASAILKNESQAEETLVDVFVQIWQQAERYDPARGSVVSWVATLARTRAIDHRRRRARELADPLPSEGDGHLAVSRDETPGPVEIFQGAEDRDRIRKAVESLPTDQRRAIEAAFYGGLSHSEVAREFGEPLGTIKTRIRSGLATLRRHVSTCSGEFA